MADLTVLRVALNLSIPITMEQLSSYGFTTEDAEQLHALSQSPEGCTLAVEYIDSLLNDATPIPIPRLS